jgi:hypothetical protein
VDFDFLSCFYTKTLRHDRPPKFFQSLLRRGATV